MFDNGWIKLNRSLGEHWLFQDAEALKLWIHLLFKASFKDAKVLMNGNLIQIKSGQCITGLTKLTESTGISTQRIRTMLKNFVADGMITIEPTSRYSIITILNWERYQSNTLTTSVNGELCESYGDYENETNTQTTNRQHADNTQTTRSQQHLKNVKNVKNVKEGKEDLDGGEILLFKEPIEVPIKRDYFAEFWELYPNKVGKDYTQKIWKKNKLDKQFDEIMKGLRLYIDSEVWHKDNGQYIHNPSTFLNKKRWLDNPKQRNKTVSSSEEYYQQLVKEGVLT